MKVESGAGNNYDPDVTPCPVKGPASGGPTPGPAAEPPGPFHSGPVVVSRVHRPAKEAFHSCLGTRDALVAASKKREREKPTRSLLSAKRRTVRRDGGLPGAVLATTTTGRDDNRRIHQEYRPASCVQHQARGPALLSLLRTHPGMQ